MIISLVESDTIFFSIEMLFQRAIEMVFKAYLTIMFKLRDYTRRYILRVCYNYDLAT